MNIKRVLVLIIILGTLSNPVIAQTKLMQITTIEGLVGGGFVKPKMIITDENEDTNLFLLFSEARLQNDRHTLFTVRTPSWSRRP